jgi:hypothetical protein
MILLSAEPHPGAADLKNIIISTTGIMVLGSVASLYSGVRLSPLVLWPYCTRFK